MLVRRAKPASGFTLIEMAVTMSIFALMVVLGVPAMRTWVSDTKVRAVTDALQNGVRQAQAESVRRSRQVVFALTNTTTPTAYPFGAVANGTSWVAYTLPSMTDGSDPPAFIGSGILSSASTNVLINSHSVAAICFNSVGRLVTNTTTVTTATGGAQCTAPSVGTPPVQVFDVTLTGADRPLQVRVTLAGQVHMCDPNVPLTSTSPEGCI